MHILFPSPIKAFAFAALIALAACKKESVDSDQSNNNNNNNKPKTGFKISPTDNALTFRFEDTSESVISRHWDFGDPARPDTSTIKETRHIYSKEGNFNVKLVVERASGIKDSVIQPLTVTIPVPTVTISRSTSNDVATISFTANVTSDNSTIKEYKWDFGDGQIVTNQNASVSHTYNNTGAYTVILTVTNNYNKTATASVLASPTVIDIIRIKKIQLTHTPRDIYDNSPFEGPCPDPYFNFYGGSSSLLYTSSTISDQCINGGAKTCVWNIDPADINKFEIPYNTSGDVHFTFFDADGIATPEPIGRTISIIDALQLKYPATIINLGSNDPGQLGVQLTIEYKLK